MNVLQQLIDKNLPLRARKSLVLDVFGLRDVKDLLATYHLYDWKNWQQCVADMKKKLATNPRNEFLAMILAKKNYIKIPVFPIKSERDMEEFIKYMTSINLAEGSNVGYQTIDKKKEAIGRIYFNNTKDILPGMAEEEQIVEQIWSTENRTIDGYNNLYDGIYAKATRNKWNTRYKITSRHNFENDDIRRRELADALKAIERNRDKITIFSEYLEELGITTFSLEYSIREGELSFEDWDSSDDKKVIERIEKAKTVNHKDSER